MCTFLYIGMGKGILCCCKLESYKLSDATRCDFQDFALSVRRYFRCLKSVGDPSNYWDHSRLNAFSSQYEHGAIVSRVQYAVD